MDLKDQMIADQQERRERMHQAVDDLEVHAEGQPWYVDLLSYDIYSNIHNIHGTLVAHRARKKSLNGVLSEVVSTGASRTSLSARVIMDRP
jgi:hypothetical protein